MSDNGVIQSMQRDFQCSMTEHYRSHLDGTNINTKTMLTTDYLNHFSGVLMLIEMLPMDPEGFADDVLSWKPMTYEEHFEVTGFRDKDLAVKAYEHAPADIRREFDGVIDNMNDVLIDVLRQVRTSVQSNETAHLAEFCAEITPVVRELMDKAANIVNVGTSNVIELHEANMQEKDVDAAQHDIDALFD